MSTPLRLAFSIVASAVVTTIAYLLPFTPLIYFFAPGFWLGDALPDSIVNALGGYLFPVFASAVIWTLLIFGVWWLIKKGLTNRLGS